MEQLVTKQRVARGFAAIPSPRGCLWHQFERGIALVFPLTIAPKPQLLVNLFSADTAVACDEIIESYIADGTQPLAIEQMAAHFGEYAESMTGNFRRMKEEHAFVP